MMNPNKESLRTFTTEELRTLLISNLEQARKHPEQAEARLKLERDITEEVMRRIGEHIERGVTLGNIVWWDGFGNEYTSKVLAAHTETLHGMTKSWLAVWHPKKNEPIWLDIRDCEDPENSEEETS